MSGESLSNFGIDPNKLIAKGTTSDLHTASRDGVPNHVAKVLRSTQKEAKEIFEKEAKLLYLDPQYGGIRHLNIIQAASAGTIRETEQPYYIMPRASEGALKSPTGEITKLSANGVKQVAQEIGAALQHIHGIELLHNNVNPHDILEHRKGADRRGPRTFWLSDWGDAVVIGQEKPSLGGDPLYRAPEKFTGQLSKAGDLYSFAATLYELATGKTPYDLPSGLTPIDKRNLLIDLEKRRAIEAYMARQHHSGNIPAFEDRWTNSWLIDPKDTAMRLAVEPVIQKALSRNASGRQGSIEDFVGEFSDHMRVEETKHQPQRKTITSSGRPGTGKIFLGDYSAKPAPKEETPKRDGTAAQSRALTDREFADIYRVAKTLGATGKTSPDVLERKLADTIAFRTYSSDQRKHLIEMYLQLSQVRASEKKGRSPMLLLPAVERTQVIDNYHGFESYLVNRKKRRRISLTVGAATVAASATLFATLGGVEGAQKPETVATVPDYKNLPPEERDIMLREHTEWKKFFGGNIEIPKVPEELMQTWKYLNKKGYYTFKPRYIPEVTVAENVDYPGWKERPNSLIKDLPKEQQTTKARWVLVDDSNPSTSADGGFGKLMGKLRDNGQIEDRESGVVDWHAERNASGEEITEVVFPAFAKDVSLDKNTVTLPTALEYNLMQVFHEEWDRRSGGEWMNSYDGDDHSKQVAGGLESEGGFESAEFYPADKGETFFGARPIINFPQTK